MNTTRHSLTFSLSRVANKTGRVFLLGMAATLLLLPQTGVFAQTATPTRTTLSAQTTDTAHNSGTTLTATVQITTGTAVTGGTVDFELAGGQSLGSAMVASDGTATLVLATLPAGSSTSVDGSKQLEVTAVYTPAAASTSTSSAADSAAATAALGTTTSATSSSSTTTGGAQFAASSSTATAVASPAATTVAADFNVTGNPTTVTVKQGTYGTTVLTVSSVGGYAGSIQLSCSGLPAQVTCAFNPTQQALAANTSFTSTLELQTQGASGTATSSLLPRSTGIALALVLPGALLLFGLRGRRSWRGVQMLGIALLLAGTGLGLSGCSQRYNYLHHGPTVAGGTPLGTYPITVAVDGDQGSAVSEHDISISLVVQ